MKKIWCCFSLWFIFVAAGNPLSVACAEEAVTMSKGQTLYVPVYSLIYAGTRKVPLSLSVTLSIRNIDKERPISVTSIDYYGENGKLLKKYLKEAVILNPFETRDYLVQQGEKYSESGANFLVEWKSDEFVNPPLIESIMIRTEGQQGISFTSRGQVIATPSGSNGKK
jgi:hypothetical protein